MPSMKGLSMNRVVSGIKRRTGTGLSSASAASNDNTPQPQNDTPEGTALHALKQFCENGSPNRQGDEVLFLPTIVEAAESSPAAAAECARQIRRYLSKDYRPKASWQYNALMIVRILADNPGQTFTRNFDRKFIDAVKDILKTGRDPSVRQMLMEILEDFEHTKFWDENLAELITMWKKEKQRIGVSHNFQRGPPMPPPQPGMMQYPPQLPMNQNSNYFARHHTNPKLPDPVELTNRLEEAKTSAKLLSQVVVNTSPQEILDNDLIKEFSDRCTSASRSIQTYMVAQNPSPDNETMESLIDTNEQLQTALNQHQRAVLNARKQLGLNPRSEDNTPDPASQDQVANMTNGQPPAPTQRRPQEWQVSQPSSSSSVHGDSRGAGGSSSAPPLRKPVSNGKGRATDENSFQPPAGPPPGVVPKERYAQKGDSDDDDEADPFADPEPGPAGASSAAAGSSSRPAVPPYQPASGPTPSYMHRQESSLDHTTMHGGVASMTPGTSSYATPQIQNQASNHVSDDIYGSNDMYESAAGRKP